jgi:hypothetical protein
MKGFRHQIAAIYKLELTEFDMYSCCVIVGSHAAESLFRQLINDRPNPTVKEYHSNVSTAKPAKSYDRAFGNELLDLTFDDGALRVLYDAYDELGAIFFNNVYHLDKYIGSVLEAVNAFRELADFYSEGDTETRAKIALWKDFKRDEDCNLLLSGIKLIN